MKVIFTMNKKISVPSGSTFTRQWILQVLVIVVTFFQLCKGQCLTRDDSKLTNSPGVHENLYKGQHDFSLALLRETNRLSPSENIFFSPYSTYHALLLAYFTSASQTEQYLSNALRLDPNQDKVDIFKAYRYDKNKRWMTSESSDKSYEFTSANKIYLSSELRIRDCIDNLFADEIQELDFRNNPLGSLQSINNWVEAQTQGMIKDLIPPDGIDYNTNLVLVNAAYFKGIWEYRFDSSLTQKKLFYIPASQPTFVDMMMQEGTFNHDASESLGAHILEMPYKGGKASMFIILPSYTVINGVDKVLAKLNAQSFEDFVTEGHLYPKKVIVSLPKFTLEKSLEMAQILEKLGVGDLFQSTSDLSTLTGVKNITLGRAIHKARIEVSEEGTKAAAATALFTFRSSRPAEPVEFLCDHPFIYIIYDKQNKAILFSGIFRRPS